MNWTEKYRPADFDQVAGNRDFMEEIESFILSDNIPHLLFAGEPGTGKTTLAQIIAGKVCGESPDNFIEINASDDRGIDIIRKTVLNAIRNLSVNGGQRVIFLDEADGLTKDAQQILRRPMEKAGKTLFIIACNDIKQIAPAIQSRCAVFQFQPITKQDVIERLRQICKAEGINLNDAALYGVAERAGGDVRAAVNELQKQAAKASRSDQVEALVNQYLKTNSAGKV
jgi:replication factor C small subunit